MPPLTPFRRRPLRTTLVAGASIGLAAAAGAQSPPLHQAGRVTAGDATLSPGATPGSAIIRLRSPSRIDWAPLNLAAGESLRIQSETGSLASLHVVRGGSVARLNGHVIADGPFYLISPGGISVGTTGRIQAPHLFMSALAAADEGALLNGGSTQCSKSASGLVEIQGALESPGGQLTVLGANISVTPGATVRSPGGQVHLAASESTSLNASGRLAVIGVPPGPKNDASRANLTTQGHVLARRIDLISEGFIRNGGHIETAGQGNRVLLSAVASTHELRPHDASRITTDNLIAEGLLRLEGPVIETREGPNPAPVGGQRQTPRLSEPGFITQSDSRSTQIAFSPMQTLATTSPIPPPAHTPAVASRRGPEAEPDPPKPVTKKSAIQRALRKASFFGLTTKK